MKKLRLAEVRGFSSIFILVGMLLVAVALPIATKLVQQNQENRSSAASTCNSSNVGKKYCSGGNVFLCKCTNTSYGTCVSWGGKIYENCGTSKECIGNKCVSKCSLGGKYYSDGSKTCSGSVKYVCDAGKWSTTKCDCGCSSGSCKSKGTYYYYSGGSCVSTGSYCTQQKCSDAKSGNCFLKKDDCTKANSSKTFWWWNDSKCVSGSYSSSTSCNEAHTCFDSEKACKDKHPTKTTFWWWNGSKCVSSSYSSSDDCLKANKTTCYNSEDYCKTNSALSAKKCNYDGVYYDDDSKICRNGGILTCVVDGTSWKWSNPKPCDYGCRTSSTCAVCKEGTSQGCSAYNQVCYQGSCQSVKCTSGTSSFPYNTLLCMSGAGSINHNKDIYQCSSPVKMSGSALVGTWQLYKNCDSKGCTGSGSSAKCTGSTGKEGSCGVAFGKTTASKPETGLCAYGTPNWNCTTGCDSKAEDGTYGWTCAGEDGTVLCISSKSGCSSSNCGSCTQSECNNIGSCTWNYSGNYCETNNGTITDITNSSACKAKGGVCAKYTRELSNDAVCKVSGYSVPGKVIQGLCPGDKHIVCCSGITTPTSNGGGGGGDRDDDNDNGGGETTVDPTGVTLDPTTLTVAVGGSETISATVLPDNANNTTVTWTSDKTAVATVDNGIVTGKSVGTAVITAKTSNGKTATANVTVVAAGTARISFKFSLRGIKPSYTGSNGTYDCFDDLKNLSVEVVNAPTNAYQSGLSASFEAVSGETNDKGDQVFKVTNLVLDSAKFGSVNTFNYVKVKGPFHLKRRMCLNNQKDKLPETTTCNIPLNSDTVYDFSDYTLLAGDVNTDGVINSVDYSYVKTKFDASADVSCGREGDLNMDGVVNSLDANLIKEALSSKDDE